MARYPSSPGPTQGENGHCEAVDTPPTPAPSDEQDGFDETDIVVKANQLIRGRINWTKLEHRVVAMLVAQLKKEDDSFKMQQVHISELMDMAQVSSRDIYDRAEEICRKLLNQKVHVRTSTEDGRRMYQGYNCLSTCRYVEGSGYIEAKFNDDMKPFLLQLKRQFTMYRLQNFMQLSSQHSMRVYELIKMREGLRYLCVSVEELREVLCCKHTYDRFSDFKRYVLERARTEIKETCDVYFTYKVERSGRTPEKVHFTIHRKDDPDTLPLIREGQDAALFDDEDASQSRDGASSQSRSGLKEKLPEEVLLDESAGRGASESAAHSDEMEANVPRYNFYATVLAGLRQEELDQLKTSTIEAALETSKRQVRHRQEDSDPRGVASIARMVTRAALAKLRGEDPSTALSVNGTSD